jgi:hypothetical protein
VLRALDNTGSLGLFVAGGEFAARDAVTQSHFPERCGEAVSDWANCVGYTAGSVSDDTAGLAKIARQASGFAGPRRGAKLRELGAELHLEEEEPTGRADDRQAEKPFGDGK